MKRTTVQFVTEVSDALFVYLHDTRGLTYTRWDINDDYEYNSLTWKPDARPMHWADDVPVGLFAEYNAILNAGEDAEMVFISTLQFNDIYYDILNVD